MAVGAFMGSPKARWFRRFQIARLGQWAVETSGLNIAQQTPHIRQPLEKDPRCQVCVNVSLRGGGSRADQKTVVLPQVIGAAAPPPRGENACSRWPISRFPGLTAGATFWRASGAF